MVLSRAAFRRVMADPKRSEAAQKGAWKRTMNERRIDSMRKVLREVEAHLEKDQLDGVTFEETAALLDQVRKYT